MWQRTLGLVIIVLVGLLYHQAMPRHFVGSDAFWTDSAATAPLAVAQPTQIRFTASEDAMYCPVIDNAVAADARTDALSAQPMFTCTIQVGNQRTTGQARPLLRRQGDGYTCLLRRFRVTRGRTYTVTVQPTQGQALLQGRTPCVRIIADPDYYYRDLGRGLLAITTSVFGSVFGLLLTLWGRSLLPLHVLFPPKP